MGSNQNINGIKMNNRKVLNQFKDKFIIVVEGSKTENKLVIIFRLLIFYFVYLKILILMVNN